MPFFVHDYKYMVLRSNVSLTALPVEETKNELQEESVMDALTLMMMNMRQSAYPGC